VSAGSDIGSFVLIEGANPITVLSTGFAASHITWANRHAGIDGAGSNIATA
jgi:hypothetical protein